MTPLEDWGWDERWAAEFEGGPGRGLVPARVIVEQRGLFGVVTADGERSARVPGGMRHKAEGRGELPGVGDWIAGEPVKGEKTLVIRRILPRRSKLSRKAAGDLLVEQLIAANLDSVFITTALNNDFNPRRLERFLAVCRESGAEPVLLLNKLDLTPDPTAVVAEARAIAGGAAVATVSAKTGKGLPELAAWIRPGRTVGFVGSSGVGKSTLINRLLGEEKMKTASIRSGDDRGRHTTTHRQLFLLPQGGILLDTPGMREMQFWEADQGVKQTFDEIESLSPSCQFRDCGHGTEPGCAVKKALDEGKIAPERLAAWQKLRAEADALRKRLKYGR